MRKLQVLKAFLLAMIWMLIVSSVVYIVLLGVSIWSGEPQVPFRHAGSVVETSEKVSMMSIIFKMIGNLVFIFGVFNLQKVVSKLSKVQIFDDEVIHSLYVSGNAFIMSGFLLKIVDWAIQFTSSRPSLLDISNDYILLFFIIVMGLFLKVMAIILRIAKTYKEENELTI